MFQFKKNYNYVISNLHFLVFERMYKTGDGGHILKGKRRLYSKNFNANSFKTVQDFSIFIVTLLT